jgi:anti-sigma factor ChrR (cupin superfamily)
MIPPATIPDGCAPYQESIYGEDYDAPVVAAHLEACASCRDLRDRLERRDREMAARPVPEPDPGLLGEILALGPPGT